MYFGKHEEVWKEGEKSMGQFSSCVIAADPKQTRLFMEMLTTRSESLHCHGSMLLCKQQSVTAKSQCIRGDGAARQTGMGLVIGARWRAINTEVFLNQHLPGSCFHGVGSSTGPAQHK